MIQVSQIASNDFVLVREGQTLGQARRVVGRLKPARVVLQWTQGDQPRYSLLTAVQFAGCFAGIEADAWLGLTIAEALRRSEAHPNAGAANVADAVGPTKRWPEATACVETYQDAESVPPRCVVLQGDQVVGFWDAVLPPVTTTRRHGADDALGAGPVLRTLEAQFAQTVTIGQTASLLVWLSRVVRHERSQSVSLLLGSRLDIVVQVQHGFAVEGSGDGSLEVTDDDEAMPVRFKLRATELGLGRFRVLCFQAGQPLGAISVTAPVVAESGAGEVQESGSSQRLAALTARQPDLVLLILEQEVHGQVVITLHLTAADPALGLNFKAFGPIRLRVDPLHYFRDFFAEIEGLSCRTADDQAIAARRLASKGTGLLHDLLPEELRALLWSLQDRVRTVEVLSDEPWIPWELLKLEATMDRRVVEGPFLCETFALTRWFLGIARRPELHLSDMALIAPAGTGLAHSRPEQDYLLSLAGRGRSVTRVRAAYLEVVEALAAGQHDAWHFTGHGWFADPDPDRSGVILEGKQDLQAADICGRVSNCGLSRPLVFLNACQVGRGGLSLTGIGGWAKRFVEAGAAAFIGPAWSVYDRAAREFARTFYDRLLAGTPIGQAATDARLSIRSTNDPSWLAYTVFADPTATVMERRMRL